MIDYFVIRISKKYLPQLLPHLTQIKDARFVPGGDGVLLCETYSCVNLDIKVYPTCIVISGSLHYFYNMVKGRGSQNYDDFSFTSMCEAINILEEKLDISLRMERLTQLEIGANIRLDRNVTDCVSENIILHNFKTHIVRKEYVKNGLLKEFETSQYWVKLYDKGRQFVLDHELARFELKYKHHSDVRRLGITCLNDLTDICKFNHLVEDYYHRLQSELIILDTIDFRNIEPQKSRDLLCNGINSTFWTNMRKEPTRRKGLNKPVVPGTIVLRKKRFLELLEVYGLTSIKAEVMTLIKSKIYDLTGLNIEQKQKRTFFHV